VTRADLRRLVSRRFARFVTDMVVSRPRLWSVFRSSMRKQFDALAPSWEELMMEDSLAPYEAALAAIRNAPQRALDLGTGTGLGARAIARRFDVTDVVGVDLSARMVAEAARRTPEELSRRVRYEVADATRLHFDDGTFDLVAHNNMIPFFDEVARVTKPNGHALFSYSSGAQTPIYVPLATLRKELHRRGFTDFAEFEAGRGVALLARKSASS
jgi:ubiquinone/menaquinone biosynthesis C-methylase UbiE